MGVQVVRTDEQIQAQLDARLAQLEVEAASPKRQRPCVTCRWQDKTYSHHCLNPLLIGFDDYKPTYDWQIGQWGKLSIENWPEVALCGPEKALWEPRPAPVLPWFARLLRWLRLR